MVGRSEQLDEIRRHISATIVPGHIGANVLFVTGEAGIGKTTLLTAIQQECASMPDSPTAIFVECSTPLAGQDIGEVEALQPWEEIIRRLIAVEGERKIPTRKLVGDLAMAWVRCIPVVGDVLESVVDTAQIVRQYRQPESGAGQAGAASQQQVFQQYINLLSTLSEQTPLVLMIDDFHWADTSSTNLLFAAARQLQGKPVCFIVAYRPDDAASSRGGEGHPILHIRNELERYSLAMEVGVPRMDAGDLDRLLRERYPDYQNNDGFEQWLAKISGGNALFITQFLQTLEEDGYVDRERGEVKEGYQLAEAPPSAYAVVRERLRRLEEETRELLRYASVEGDMFTMAMLAKITGTPKLKLLQRLRLAEETHRVVVNLGKQWVYAGETTAYRFSHALLHTVMYDSLSQEERELLHEAIFDVLKEEWEVAVAKGEQINLEGTAARLAVHAGILGQPLFAAGILLDGARASWREYAEKETLRLLDGVFDQLAEASRTIGHATAETIEIESKGRSLRGDIHRNRGRLEAALDDYDQTLLLLEQIGDTRGFIDILNNKAIVHRYRSEYDAARAAVGAALEQAEGIGYVQGEFSAMNILGNIMQRTVPAREMLEWRMRVLVVAERCGRNGYEEAIALDNLGLVRRALGEIDEALKCYDRALEIHTAHNDRDHMANVLNNIGTAYYSSNRFDEARLAHERCCEICRATGDEWMEAYAINNLGDIACHDGDYQRALEHYRRTIAIADRVGDVDLAVIAYRCLGDTLRATGQLAEAVEQYRLCLDLSRNHNDHASVAGACIALASIHLELDDDVAARQWVEQAGEEASLGADAAVIAEADGQRGVVDAAGARQLAGALRQQQLASAIARVEGCVTTLQELEHENLEKWEKELMRLKESEGENE